MFCVSRQTDSSPGRLLFVSFSRYFILWIQCPQVPIMICKCDSFIALFIHSQAPDPWKTGKNELGVCSYQGCLLPLENDKQIIRARGIMTVIEVMCKGLQTNHSSAYSWFFTLCSFHRPLLLLTAHRADARVFLRGLQTAAHCQICCLFRYSLPAKNDLHIFKWLGGGHQKENRWNSNSNVHK